VPRTGSSSTKIDRVEWARYLLWVRETVGIPGREPASRYAASSSSARRPHLDGEGNPFVHAKWCWRWAGEGSGALRWPEFATLAMPRVAWQACFHSADDIDFGALKGKRVGILGAGASAFDNAAPKRSKRAPRW